MELFASEFKVLVRWSLRNLRTEPGTPSAFHLFFFFALACGAHVSCRTRLAARDFLA